MGHKNGSSGHRFKDRGHAGNVNRHNGKAGDDGLSHQTIIVVPPYDNFHSDVYDLVFKNFIALENKFRSGQNGDPAKFSHIDFILKSGANLSSKLPCHCCHKGTAKYLRIKEGHLVPCCGSPKCRSGCSSDGLLPLSFEAFNIPIFSSSPEMREELKRMLKSALGLPENPSPESIYTVLKKNYELSVGRA